jgi:integrase
MDAYARWRTHRKEEIEERKRLARRASSQHSVYDACKAYLYHVQVNGAQKTLADRMDTLFDLCWGLPPEYRQEKTFDPKKMTKAEQREAETKRLHEGYGHLPAMSLTFTHIDQWIASHDKWGRGGIRTRIQAVKRALNYAREAGYIQKNPIRGYKVKKATNRVTYITPEQEKELIAYASAVLKTAIRVCIRTGARPGKEFCKLTSRHVTDYGDRMEWKFAIDESKTDKLRIIRIVDPDIIKITREQMESVPPGEPIFRSMSGEPWTRYNLSQRFRFLKYKLEKKGVEFDKDCCMYSCRHTYAKRTLEGFWTGKPCNIETLARLMGNSPQVCRDHYLQFSIVDNEFLWENA